MKRRTKLTIAGGLTLLVLVTYLGGAALAKGAFDTVQSFSVPPETLLTLADLPPGFEVAPDVTQKKTLETFTARTFTVRPENWHGGPSSIVQHVVRLRMPVTDNADRFLDT